MTAHLDPLTNPATRTSNQDDIERTAQRMAGIGACWSPSFSPDGNRIAFISNLNGSPQVWTVPTKGGWPELVTILEDHAQGVSWSPDGEWLAFTIAPGGGFNQQIYLVQPDGTRLRKLTCGGKVSNWLGRWTRDGKGLIVNSNRRKSDVMDTYLVDINDGRWRLAAENQGVNYVADISRDQSKIVIRSVVRRGEDDLFLIDLQSGEKLLLTGHEGACNFSFARFSTDWQTIFLSSNWNRERKAFARIRIGDDNQPGAIEVITSRDDADLQEFVISRDGAKAILCWNIDGRNEISFLDLAAGNETPGPRLPAEIISGMRLSRNGQYLAMAVSGSTTPTNIWVLDCHSNRFSQVSRSPHAGVNLATLIRPRPVSFLAHDGLRLSGWLYEPANFSRPGPIALSFHGGPESQERPAFNSTYQALLSEGIAVFAPNVRGSSGFGRTFCALDNGSLRVNAIRDIKTCADYLVNAAIAEPGRIGIMGSSYGGYMTMAGLTEFPELFAAGVNLFGIVNFETFFALTDPMIAAFSKVKYGDPDTELEMLRELSPIRKIHRVRAATLVLHGANDTNVPVAEAKQVFESLNELEVPTRLIVFPDEWHGFSKMTNRLRATVEIVRWFSKYLK